jgi:multicomponent Na+:H+ antiporter subunit C
MTQIIFFLLVAMGLFTIGLYVLLVDGHLIRKIMALNIMASSIFLFLIAIAVRYLQAIDPLPHAMVLVGIVIMVSATALGLKLAQRIYQEIEHQSLPEKNGSPR